MTRPQGATPPFDIERIERGDFDAIARALTNLWSTINGQRQRDPWGRMGDWIDDVFDEAKFSAGVPPVDWDVDLNPTSNLPPVAYALAGSTMILNVCIASSQMANADPVLTTLLEIALPVGYRITVQNATNGRSYTGACLLTLGSTYEIGSLQVQNGAPGTILVARGDRSAFPNGLIQVFGQVIVEVAR